MQNDIRIELINTTNVLLNAINDKAFKRRDIAQLYAFALRSSDETDWSRVNRAIIDRWSISALEYIKNLAWSGKAFNEQRK